MVFCRSKPARSNVRVDFHLPFRSRTSWKNSEILVGDKCETIFLVTVRVNEAFTSDIIMELPRGRHLEIVEVGRMPRRAKVRFRQDGLLMTGWISVKTRLNEALIAKRAGAAYTDFWVGGHLEVLSPATMRRDEALSSDVVAELSPGTMVMFKEIGQTTSRRAKIGTDNGEGWISLWTKQGEPLFCEVDVKVLTAIIVQKEAKLHANVVDAGGASLKECGFAKNAKISDLEKEVLGDLKPKWPGVSFFSDDCTPVLQSPLKQHGRLTMKQSLRPVFRNTARPSRRWKLLTGLTVFPCRRLRTAMGELHEPKLNCSDTREEAALIYAAAFKHRPAMDDLLCEHEVNVDAVDDTEKTALHHVSKLPKSGDSAPHATDDVQARIVKALVNRQAHVDARDHNGCTALMFAAAHGNEPVAKLLLEAGANLNARDHEGHTPASYATNFGHGSFADSLKQISAGFR
mmetsp:Transcript_4220/g.8162  ORF Transcript_4220/g.8162 Transcript_4220/m.8162 type:complete len:459 (-) Transcript_4220:126-1502(-)